MLEFDLNRLVSLLQSYAHLPPDKLCTATFADLVAALREGCPWLVTFNVRHFRPGHPNVTALRPREFVLSVRDLLTRLTAEEEP